MSRETILQIAKECGAVVGVKNMLDCTGEAVVIFPDELERFAHRMMAEGVKMAAEKCSEYQTEKFAAYDGPASSMERGNPFTEGQAHGGIDCEMRILALSEQLEKGE